MTETAINKNTAIESQIIVDLEERSAPWNATLPQPSIPHQCLQRNEQVVMPHGLFMPMLEGYRNTVTAESTGNDATWAVYADVNPCNYFN